MTLFEQVTCGPTKRSENLRFLKKTDCAVIILGIGEVAKWTTAILMKNGIGVDGYCVSDEFWKSGLKFGDVPVYPMSEVFKRFDKFIAILAVGSNRKKLRNELMEHRQVVDCLEFDCPTVSEICDREQLLLKQGQLESLYTRFEDDYSRRTMTAFLNARISGELDLLQKLELPEEVHYLPDFIVFAPNEYVVDCGAYDGDTLEMFLKHVGSAGKYFALECDPVNFKKLQSKFGGNDNIVLLPYGVSDSDRTAFMDSGGGTASKISEKGEKAIQLTTIDRIINDNMSNCTYIKMDIEGEELAALHGAEQTILKYRPKLAICVYHKAEDLWTIPQYILSLHHDYKLYLRKYVSPFSCELVLYAI